MAGSIDTITLRRPDDWHVHLRDAAMLAQVLPYTARQFARAVVMPNLVPPVTTVAAARAYRERVLAALPAGAQFAPLMTCYLTDTTDAEEVAAGFAAGFFCAVKLYPAHATTNSASGVSSIARVEPVLERMAEIGMPLLVHGEVVDPEIDIFDREAVFIDRVLDPLRRRLPELRIVLEHITTIEAVEYVRAAQANLAATITRIICTSIAMRCLPAVSDRIFTACRLPNANGTARRCAPPRPPATTVFFSAPTALRMPAPGRRRRAAAPGFLRPSALSNSMPKCSKSATPWIASKPSPR